MIIQTALPLHGRSLLTALTFATCTLTTWTLASAQAPTAEVEAASAAQPQTEAAAGDAPATALAPVVVIGTVQPRSELDMPAAVGRVDATALHDGQPQISLAESLGRVPGITVRERNNYAQDLQIQSRGFGARSSFGVRGVQLRLDGIPVSAPDGQGQSSGFLISALDHIEVLRGPLAYGYGNSAGGVVAAWSAAAPERTEWRAQVGAGSDNTWRGALAAGGQGLEGKVGYRAELAQFRTDGARPHSEAERTQAALVANADLGAGRRLSLLFNSVSQPETQDPLGLTRAQYDDNPRQTTAVALTYNTRKRVDDRLGGLRYQQDLAGGDSFELVAFGSTRAVEQYLSIPKSVQASTPTNAGGVIDLERSNVGAEARYVKRWTGLTLSLGLEAQRLDEARHGYENFVGDTLGVRGALRRDEDNRLNSFDQVVLAEWQPAPEWLWVAALRHSALRFDSNDHYITGDNPDDSGAQRFSETTPALSVQYRINAPSRIYASWGEGFETPTANELSYRPDGGSGYNSALKAARSRTTEVGYKRSLGARGLLTLAAYHTDTHDEIVPAINSGGRTSYQNAPGTRRRGVELAVDAALTADWNAYFAADLIDAHFSDAYTSVSGGNPATVDSGNRVPGVARSNLFGELGWRRGRDGWSAALEGRYVDSVPVNDLNSDEAAAYTVVGARVIYGRTADWGGYRLFLRGDNLLDRDYAGSVIANEGNGRYFEPGVGRSVFAGLELRFTP